MFVVTSEDLSTFVFKSFWLFCSTLHVFKHVLSFPSVCLPKLTLLILFHLCLSGEKVSKFGPACFALISNLILVFFHCSWSPGSVLFSKIYMNLSIMFSFCFDLASFFMRFVFLDNEIMKLFNFGIFWDRQFFVLVLFC